MAYTPPLLLTTDSTPEERWAVIMRLSDRIMTHKKTRDAYDRLFGSEPPHRHIEQLTHFNAKVFSRDYKKALFEVLGSPERSQYRDGNFLERHFLDNVATWKNSTLLDPWNRTADTPNPHHIIPTSRWWVEHVCNIREVDRSMHNDFHSVFQNLTPVEQYLVLLNTHRSSFSLTLQRSIRALVSGYMNGMVYRKGVVQKKYIPRSVL